MNASAVEMSGCGAPAFTATPTTELAMSRPVPAAQWPSCTSSSNKSGVTTTTSALRPSRIHFTIVPPGPHDGAKVKPVDFANSGAMRSSTPLSATVVKTSRDWDKGLLR